jgi:hypothetical protein
MHKQIGLAVLFILILAMIAIGLNQHFQTSKVDATQQTDYGLLRPTDRNTPQTANNDTFFGHAAPINDHSPLRTDDTTHDRLTRHMKQLYQQAKLHQGLDTTMVKASLADLDSLESLSIMLPAEAKEHRQWLAEQQPQLASTIAQTQAQFDQKATAHAQRDQQQRQQALSNDSAFQQYKQEESRIVNETLQQYPQASAQRDALIQQRLDVLHRQIYGAGS